MLPAQGSPPEFRVAPGGGEVVHHQHLLGLEPVPLAAWPDDGRRSRLVFITRGIDAADIKRTFATFRFNAGRAARNLTLNPATYAQFAETMQLFRTSSGRTKELESR